ncbi:hypothetical protein K491DRAFT_711907 [Lophiostoma macrostomum CBS 122681]|uniref:F-box domain-containing protein n=1 Tax=Lophiostoma macrostomum CBS 122681 TaxID=1314788 RepID=A0A6A6TN95_9PLEO|nr:hypothetical protein K491DRAFT_711907 [Lophiostoma macrostomum CBS 122681]
MESDYTVSLSSETVYGPINVWASSVDHVCQNGSTPLAITTNSSGFMKLPLEVRNLIYLSAMDDSPEEFEVKGAFPERPRRVLLSTLLLRKRILPAISITSRTTLYESMLVYLERTRIVLKSHRSDAEERLSNFLTTFPHNQGFAAIRSIRYDMAGRYTDQFRLFNHVPGLQRLTIAFDMRSISRRRHGIRWRLLTKKDLDSRFNFDPIFRLRNLKELRIYCDTRWDIPVFDDLIELFGEKIQERSDELRLLVEFPD